MPYSDCDSMCSMLSTVVVRLRSVMEMILSAISCGGSPLKFQMMLTTGISMFGKISVGVRTIANAPNRKIRIASTTIVYGSFSASLTIHMIHIPYFCPVLPVIRPMDLSTVLGRLHIQCRDQLLSGGGYSDRSGEDDLPRRNLLA